LASTTRTLPHPPSAAAPAALDGAAGRWLLPSFSDCLFLAVLIWILLQWSGAGRPARGWRLGLAHPHGRVYSGESGCFRIRISYSFSKAGAPWYAWEWLTDVIYAALHQAAGLKGLVLLSAVVIALFAWTLFRQMAWRGSSTFVGAWCNPCYASAPPPSTFWRVPTCSLCLEWL